MSLLGNLSNMGGMGQNNPMQMFMQMFKGGKPNQKAIMGMLKQQNPQLFNQVQEMTGGNPNNAKNMVLEKVKNGNFSKEQFEQFKGMAKQFGVDDSTLGEIEQYIK